MNSAPKPHAIRYSVADYMSWPDEEHWELIDGVPYNMSPAPAIKHQNIAGAIYALLRSKLRGKSCQPFIAPVDVVLSEHDVVQPDVMVICDPAKITERNIQGVPDWVAEVLSPSTARKDLREKKALFERSGVREYVVFDPLECYVQRFCLTADGAAYGAAEIFDPGEGLPLGFMGDDILPLWEIFDVAPAASEDLTGL
ncbi:MAG: Uma2 family endonuclease [Gammaproteobacteria bacterium]